MKLATFIAIPRAPFTRAAAPIAVVATWVAACSGGSGGSGSGTSCGPGTIDVDAQCVIVAADGAADQGVASDGAQTSDMAAGSSGFDATYESGGSSSGSSSGADSSSGSSGSSSTSSSSGSDSGTGDSGTTDGAADSATDGPESGASEASTDALADASTDADPCAAVSQAYFGVKISFDVTWGMGGASPGTSTYSSGGPRTASLWFLVSETGGASFTGSALACGELLPDLHLNTFGGLGVGGLPSGGTGLVEMEQISSSKFDTLSRTYPLTGTQGFGAGSTVTVQAFVSLFGMPTTSTYATASTAWPAYCPSTSANCTGATCSGGTCTGNAGTFTGSDVGDDDNDGWPGLTAVPITGSANGCTGTCSYYDPPLSVGVAGLGVADQVYVVQRNRISFSVTRAADCSTMAGNAHVTLFDNHVVGCHIAGGGQCTSGDVGFLDQNRSAYVDGSGNAFSAISPTNNGSAQVYQFPPGAMPACTEVRAMLP